MLFNQLSIQPIFRNLLKISVRFIHQKMKKNDFDYELPPQNQLDIIKNDPSEEIEEIRPEPGIPMVSPEIDFEDVCSKINKAELTEPFVRHSGPYTFL